MYAEISLDEMRQAVDPRYWVAQTEWPCGTLVMAKLAGSEVTRFAVTELDVSGAKRAQQMLLMLVEHRWMSRVDIVADGWTAVRRKAERGNAITLTLVGDAGYVMEEMEVWWETI